MQVHVGARFTRLWLQSSSEFGEKNSWLTFLQKIKREAGSPSWLSGHWSPF